MKITQKTLIESSSIPASLIRSVVRQSGGWQSFTESAPDIANHGINGGFHGWIYTADTCKFFKNNKSLIMEWAEQQADDQGIGVFEMISQFGVFKNDHMSVDSIAKAIYTGKGEGAEIVQNVMAWLAAEEVARAYNDLLENA